ncbi:MAG: NAD(P)/FAD-dependent oxidoreductase [Candidatus Hydrothermarchaeales archaeon]
MDHDVIVVGGGISGLLTTLALSKEGKRVLLLERSNHLGGVCRSYKVDGYTVDTGPHVLTGMIKGPTGVLMDRYFDVLPKLIPHGKYYLREKEKLYAFPWTLKEWALFGYLPISDRFALTSSMLQAYEKHLRGADLNRISVYDILKEKTLSDKTWRFVETTCTFLTGLSSRETPLARIIENTRGTGGYIEKLSGLVTRDGAAGHVYPAGGIGKLTESILLSFKSNVEIKVDSEVKKIATSDGEVDGVETTEEYYSSDMVIFSGRAALLPEMADLPQDYAEMLGELTSVQALSVWLGLKKKYVTTSGSEIWCETQRSTWVVPTSNYDPHLAPKGRQLVGAGFSLPSGGFNLDREKEIALACFEENFPGIERHIEMEHYQVLTPEKAAYSVKNTLPTPITPIKGLYLVGTDTDRRAMGVTKASHSVLRLLDILRRETAIEPSLEMATG